MAGQIKLKGTCAPCNLITLPRTLRETRELASTIAAARLDVEVARLRETRELAAVIAAAQRLLVSNAETKSSRDIVNFPSELCRRRSGMFAEVARLVPP